MGPDDYDRIPETVPPLTVGDDVDFAAVELGERIGTGGDADVYRATVTHRGDAYPVAVKQPRFEGTIQERAVEEFESEAETWARLDDHDNVVTVYAWGTEPLPWLALEYMDGGTLATMLGDLDLPEALWLAGRIAEGVRHGHRHGVAHLDLKPTNLLLRETGPGTWDYPKVSDWGLAKLLLRHSNSVEGLSPTCAAPEQFDSETFGSADDLTDVYQLGAVVYALLTGEPPFTGPSAAVMRSVLQDTPEPPSAVDPSLPPAVDEVVTTALAKRKDDRYEGVLPFRKALDRLFESVVDAERGASGAVAAPADDPFASAATATAGGHEPSPESTDSAASMDRDTGDDGDGLVTRRRALGVLGVGVVGAGGWLATTDRSGDRTDSAGMPGDDTATPQPTATRTVTPTATRTPTASPTETSTGTAPGISGDEVDNATQDALLQLVEPAATITVGPGGRLQFDPETLAVSQGDVVEWAFDTGGHNVSGHPDANEDVSLPAGAAPFASYDASGDDVDHLSTREAGDSYRHQFEVTGDYTYVCVPHASSGMIGRITVR
ncbi:protein kinase [Haloplanus litoreus]|uniref:protein kinase domain-containing protein n=1 Tax=Haloplanus litoreus TaxID=767515 RepID=UPI00360B018B